MKGKKSNNRTKTTELVKIAIVGALYVALSLIVAPFSFGAIQCRLSELFNHLVIFNKRYIWSVILGCVIVNLFSPLGMYDLIFGVAGSLLSTFGIYAMTKWVDKFHKNWGLPTKLVLSSIISAVTMFPVAIELMLVSHVPFWITYATTAFGELVSCLIGALIIYAVNKRVDLSK